MYTITKLFQLTVNISAALAALSIAVPAQSEPWMESAPRSEIKTKNVDFSSQTDIDALKKLAQSAAGQLCYLPIRTDIIVQLEQRACFEHAMSDVTAQINRRRATADARNNGRRGEGPVVASAANSIAR